MIDYLVVFIQFSLNFHFRIKTTSTELGDSESEEFEYIIKETVINNDLFKICLLVIFRKCPLKPIPKHSSGFSFDVNYNRKIKSFNSVVNIARLAVSNTQDHNSQPVVTTKFCEYEIKRAGHRCSKIRPHDL